MGNTQTHIMGNTQTHLCPNLYCKTRPTNRDLLLCKEYMYICAKCGTMWHPKTNKSKITYNIPQTQANIEKYEQNIKELKMKWQERNPQTAISARFNEIMNIHI